MEERIQKILSNIGMMSRREAERLISDGLVRVNGHLVKLGDKADRSKDKIMIQGRRFQLAAYKYVLFYKPKNCMCTESDPEGRPTIWDFLRLGRPKLHSVGRLDFDVEGALLLTNDGDLSNNLLQPDHHVEKTYQVKVKGIPGKDKIDQLQQGMKIGRVRYKKCQAKVSRIASKNSWITLTLFEGKHHQVKEMMEAIGHPALKIIRWSFAGISIQKMNPTQYRELYASEVNWLKSIMGTSHK